MLIILLGLSLLQLILIGITLSIRTPEVNSLNDDNSKLLEEFRSIFGREIANVVSVYSNHRSELDVKLENLRKNLDEKLAHNLKDAQENARLTRQDSANGRQELQLSLSASLKEVDSRIQNLTASNEEKQKEIRNTLETQLTALRQENEKKLEEMRKTVDEKLQDTLEKRIGSSFAEVQKQLENVHKGLGEMQGLAKDVGNLSRVLTNVKSRGGWGEVQLQRQLEDVLNPDQFEANVKTNPLTRDMVEFAIKLPGRLDDEFVYLPIDSKFPQEDYERLLIAQDSGVKEEIDKCSNAIESTIKLQAKTISNKYLNPPKTTDFAIMYLPTEGLFAEVVRRPGLMSILQNESRVTVMGPTTLMAFLNALHMGFRTLAIEKKSSDVWKVLGATKSEFAKYGKVWEKLEKQLATAQTTVTDAGRLTRTLERNLKSVESYDVAELGALEDFVKPNDSEDDLEEELNG